MNKKCTRCGSLAINHHLHGRDGSHEELCDVCFWRARAEDAAAALRGVYELRHRHIVLSTWEAKWDKAIERAWSVLAVVEEKREKGSK